jgi:hypothetical protein
MVRAIIAFTAGSTVFTPTSQGSINFTPDYVVLLWHKLFKYAAWHSL